MNVSWVVICVLVATNLDQCSKLLFLAQDSKKQIIFMTKIKKSGYRKHTFPGCKKLSSATNVDPSGILKEGSFKVPNSFP